MENNLLVTLERASRDRDFFILNKNRVVEAYNYLEKVLASYIDICCNKFNSFEVNKISYIYGSIITLSLAMVLSKDKFFTGALGNDPVEYLSRDIFPLFVEAYNTTTLVEETTQSHMLNGAIQEFRNIVKKLTKYAPGKYEAFYQEGIEDVKKAYLNQILQYCVDRKKDKFDEKDVVNELLPHLLKIPF